MSSAQGSTVSWQGGNIGSLTGFKFSPGQAVSTDMVTAGCYQEGAGGQSRIWKFIDCTTVDPGTASVTLLGCPNLSGGIGSKGTLSINFPGGSVSLQAILKTFDCEGSVGDLLRGSAEFQFTGS